MSFDPVTSPVDYVLLEGKRSPGLATISGADNKSRWDERRGFALSGARVVYRGMGLSRPTLTLRLYTVDDWAGWHQWRPLVQRPPVGERATASDIWHPILEDLGITAVVVENVLQPKQTAPGEWTIEIKLIEHRAPVFTLENVDASAATPTDPVERRIAELTAQVGVLAGEPQ